SRGSLERHSRPRQACERPFLRAGHAEAHQDVLASPDDGDHLEAAVGFATKVSSRQRRPLRS
ncbi:MAG: hypothetical protein ACRDSN_16760, partial [Pseudonocardiaceae bacterium]